MNKLTTPLHTQNQVIVTLPIHLFNRLLRSRFIVEADKGEALSSTGLPISAHVYPRYLPEMTEQFSEIVFLSVL